MLQKAGVARPHQIRCGVRVINEKADADRRCTISCVQEATLGIVSNYPVTAPDPGIVEKQYLYRYRWSAVISVVLIGGALAAGTIWLALSERRPWILILAVPLVAMFVLGGRAALINVQGRHRLVVAQDGLYVPAFWNDRSYTRIPFQAITRMETLEHEGAAFCHVWVGKRKYSLADSWLSREDFAQVVETINARTGPLPPREVDDLD